MELPKATSVRLAVRRNRTACSGAQLLNRCEKWPAMRQMSISGESEVPSPNSIMMAAPVQGEPVWAAQASMASMGGQGVSAKAVPANHSGLAPALRIHWAPRAVDDLPICTSPSGS